jgi:D-glucuronyl C5-epimerase C-terminus
MEAWKKPFNRRGIRLAEGTIRVVRGSPFALVALTVGLIAASPAAASPVLRVGDGTAVVRDDPYLPAAQDLPPGPAGRAPAVRRPSGVATAAGKSKKKPTVDSELRRFLKSETISKGDYKAYLASWKRAKRMRRKLTGQRGTELGAVISNTDWMASVKRLEPTRLKAIFLTLDRNRELWGTRAELPGARGRTEFDGSEIVWEYYPGQGIQIQPLGTFGKANGLWTAGDQDARLARLFEEMIPLMAKRGSSSVWEYYFFFGGGRPPWASGMAQATGLQALSRSINRLERPEWRAVIRPALKLFEIRPPTGVRIDTPAGRHYLQYSFTPGTRIINAFLQSVIGLYEAANQLDDPIARKLAELGDAEARVELPRYDTGAWGLYELGGAEATLDYFKLARSFLKRLCETVRASEYCNEYQTYTDYLRAPPETRLLTTATRAKRKTNLRFRLNKASNVGVAIDDPSGRNVFFSQGDYGHGTRAVQFTPPEEGVYAIRISAVDLNGNKKETAWTVDVKPATKTTSGKR